MCTISRPISSPGHSATYTGDAGKEDAKPGNPGAKMVHFGCQKWCKFGQNLTFWDLRVFGLGPNNSLGEGGVSKIMVFAGFS